MRSAVLLLPVGLVLGGLTLLLVRGDGGALPDGGIGPSGLESGGVAADAANELEPLVPHGADTEGRPAAAERTAPVPGARGLAMSFAETRWTELVLRRRAGVPLDLPVAFRVTLLGGEQVAAGVLDEQPVEVELPVGLGPLRVTAGAPRVFVPETVLPDPPPPRRELPAEPGADLEVLLGGQVAAAAVVRVESQGIDETATDESAWLRSGDRVWRVGGRREETVHDGRVLLEGLPARRSRVEVVSSGRNVLAERWIDLAPGEGRVLVVEGRHPPERRAFTGRVTSGGRPVAGAELDLALQEAPVPGPAARVLAGADGGFRLETEARGAVAVRARIPGQRPGTFELELLLESGRDDGLVLEIPGARLVGRLLEPDGTPAQRVSVRLGPVEGETWHQRSGPDGRFAFLGVPSGRVVLAVAGPAPEAGVPVGGRFPLLEREVELLLQTTDVGDLTLGLEAAGCLAGRVLGPDGEPLSWARVYLRPPGGEGPWEWAASTRFDGSFLVEHRPVGPAELTVVHDDPQGVGALLAEPMQVELEPFAAGAAGPAVLVLELTAAARVELHPEPLPEVPEGWVHMEPAGGLDPGRAVVERGAGELPPGTGFAPSGRVIRSGPLPAGSLRLTFGSWSEVLELDPGVVVRRYRGLGGTWSPTPPAGGADPPARGRWSRLREE